MTADQAIGLAVAIVLLPFVLIVLAAILDGDIRRHHVARFLQVALLWASAVSMSDAQGTAQAQQAQADTAASRITRAEDQILALTTKGATLEQIAASTQATLQELTRMNAAQNERITANEQSLKDIATTNAAVQKTQEEFIGKVQTWLAVATGAILLGGFLLDLRREKRYRNGHNPMAAPVAQLEEKLSRDRKETNDLLRALVDRMPQPRRTR